MNPRSLILALALIFFEWLDFSLYLYLAKSVFALEFFAPDHQSLMLAFAVFSAAYLARPLGGWLFGRQADKTGRSRPMIYSAALMGISTLGICFLPSFSMIGSWAAWGLLAFRMGQGLALGGESNTSAMFIVEHHSNHRLLAGSLIAITAALGMFTGGALAAIIQWLDWNGLWREVFAVLGFLSLWVCSLRQHLKESPEFLKARTAFNLDVSVYWPGVFNIAVVAAFISVSVYLCNVFWVSFAIDNQLMAKGLCLWVGAFAQLLAALLALPIVLISSERHVYQLLRSSMLIMIFVAPALFYSTAQGWLGIALLSVAGYSLANALFSSALYYFLYLQLPVNYRCSGVSLVWGLAASAGAMALPFVQHSAQAGQVWLPVLLVSITAWFARTVLQTKVLRHDALPGVQEKEELILP